MKILGFLLIFFNGFVMALNLSLLLPTNDLYQASWIKVLICFGLSITGVLIVNSDWKDK